jgi:dipeptidyl aminopeptidase/acylaminoacyl peptidase
MPSVAAARPSRGVPAWSSSGSSLIAFALLAAASAATAAHAAPADSGPHPFSVRDMVAMERLSDPRLSPDGRSIVYSQRRYDWDANATSIHLWVVSVDGGAPRPLTTGKSKDTSPAWSPDGKAIAFVSDRSGSSQIWTIDPTGGEAAQLTRFPVDVDNPRWAPGGRRIAFSAEVYPDCPDLQCTADRDKKADDDPVKARLFERLPIRHWDTWEDAKRSHIFVWTPGGIGAASAQGEKPAFTPVDIMKGMDADAPPKPFGGAEEYSWSADGKSIAFTSKVRPQDDAWSTDLDIYLVSAEGGAAPRCLSEANEAQDGNPVFSPDGKTIAWLAMSRPKFEADRQRVVLYDVASGSTKSVTDGWDRSASSLAWAPDGKRLYVTADETGRVKIFSLTLAAGGDARVAVVEGDGHNGSVEVGRDRIVYLHDSMIAPAEVWTARPDGAEKRALTRVNAGRMAQARVTPPEEFWFQGAGGDRVHGWLIKPVGYAAGKKYPLAFLIHGGPQGAWADQFHYRWNFEAFAGSGYMTVAINPRGSTGYGQSFTDQISTDWGGKPYEDLMKGLDHLLATRRDIDADRMCALGASYGGYMINWINGHTDRFRCLVSHDGELDVKSSYYSTEELWFPEWEFGGTPWEHPEGYEKVSPEAFVAQWKTPMMVVHGAKDFRLPETEGFGVFTALQRRGIPSQLLYFPDENHWVLKPRNSVRWYDTVLAWLDRWTGSARR